MAALTFRLDPELTPELAEQLTSLWTDVSNAGGAVGFVPPVTPADVRPVAQAQYARVRDGSVRLVAGFDDADVPQATAFLTLNTHRLMRHWLWLYTVMVRPSLQGQGVGADLMAAVEKAARSVDGIRGIRLGCRGGTGVDRFYARCGYREVGRVPEAIKVADGDYRDDITMWLPLETGTTNPPTPAYPTSPTNPMTSEGPRHR